VPSGVQTQAQAGHAAIGGVGTVTKTGAGTAVLNAVNTVTGTTFVQGGTLRIDEPNALFGSPTVVRAGATLAVTDGVTARLPAVTLAGGTLAARALVVNGSSGISTLTIASGVLAGGPALSVGVGGRVSLTGPSTTIAVSTLAVDQAAGGKIDLGRGRIGIAAGGIREADLLADIAAGRGTGTWAGTAGITSSAAASDVSGGRLRAVGWLTGSDGGITVGFAAPGDTNLDGVIDILDAGSVVGGALFDTGARAVWAQGDFNYDGVLDILDVADFVGTGLFDSGDYLSAASAGTGLASGDAVGFAAVAVVPEPAAPMLVAVAAAAFFLGRRRPG